MGWGARHRSRDSCMWDTMCFMRATPTLSERFPTGWDGAACWPSATWAALYRRLDSPPRLCGNLMLLFSCWRCLGWQGFSIAVADALEGAMTADLVSDPLRGTAYGVLGAINGVGDLVASVVVGILWTALSPVVGVRLRRCRDGIGRDGSVPLAMNFRRSNCP